MKAYYHLFAFIILICFSNSLSAQFNIGPMLVFGSDTDLGFGIKAEFDATDQVAISPSFAFLSSSKITLFGETLKTSASELNADAHYVISNNGNVNWYALGGLNIAFATVSVDGDKESASEIGLNLGAGAEFDVSDSIRGFAQAKYAISKADQLGIHAGIYYSIGGN